MQDDNRGWAVVTGASGGIGRLLAIALAERGYDTIIAARSAAKLQTLAEEIRAKGRRCEAVPADLSTREGIEALAARAEALGPVDLLVNNAGVLRTGSFLRQSSADEEMMIGLNVEALAALTRRFVPGMVERNRGGVIQIASTAGLQPVPYWTTYAATKAFVVAFGQGLSHELRGTNVRIVTVCPGFTSTGLYDESGPPGLARKLLPFATPEQVVRSALRAYDRGRVVSVVGWANWLMATFGGFAPRSFQRWFIGKLFDPKEGEEVGQHRKPDSPGTGSEPSDRSERPVTSACGRHRA